MAHVGYKRVSTDDQSTESQLIGIHLDEVYEETISGVSAKRPELEACIKFLRKGDTLHIERIDRLARSVLDLEKIMEEITKKGVIVKFHKDNLTFDKENEDPVGTLTFNMLASFAQFERKLISMRCKAGIDKAKKNGVRLGREPSLSKEDIKALKLAIETGDKSKKEIADAFGISRATIYRIIKKENIKE